MTTKKRAIAALLLVGLAACKKDNTTDPDDNTITNPDPVATETLTVSQLKAFSTASSVTINKESTLYKLKGVILSDNSTSASNIDSKTAVLVQEDNAAGLIVNFTAAHSFAAGTEVEIGVSNQKLEQVHGEIVLNAIPVDSAKTMATGKAIAAKETSIADILANKEAMNGTLVKIAATELTGTDGTFSGTLAAKDASGEITSEIVSAAGFAGDAYPPSVSALTGIVRINGDAARIDIRKADDVVVGDITRILVENFDNLMASENNITAGTPLLLSGNYGFSTAFGQWLGLNNAIFKYTGEINNDESFTTTGKYYPYIFLRSFQGIQTSNIVGAIYPQFTDNRLQHVKTVKVTFAGSNATKLDVSDYLPISGLIRNLNNLVEGTDYIQVGIYPGSDEKKYLAKINGEPASDLLKYSEQYDKLGNWYTLTYTVPTKAELLAAGVSETSADDWLANPNFMVVNYSSLRTGEVTNGVNYLAPILIDKIEFGF